MRTITTHHTNEVNRKIFVEADDRDPDNGNASHSYHIGIGTEGTDLIIGFQHGSIKENGVNGLTNEVLLAIVIDRLEGFQSSKFACLENAVALEQCRNALNALESRTKNREARGVEGTHEV